MPINVFSMTDSSLRYFAATVNAHWLAEADACAAELGRRTTVRRLRELRKTDLAPGNYAITEAVHLFVEAGGGYTLRLPDGYVWGGCRYDRKRQALQAAAWELGIARPA